MNRKIRGRKQIFPQFADVSKDRCSICPYLRIEQVLKRTFSGSFRLFVFDINRFCLLFFSHSKIILQKKTLQTRGRKPILYFQSPTSIDFFTGKNIVILAALIRKGFTPRGAPGFKQIDVQQLRWASLNLQVITCLCDNFMHSVSEWGGLLPWETHLVLVAGSQLTPCPFVWAPLNEGWARRHVFWHDGWTNFWQDIILYFGTNRDLTVAFSSPERTDGKPDPNSPWRLRSAVIRRCGGGIHSS